MVSKTVRTNFGKTIIAAFAVVMALGITGCGSSSGTKAPEKEKPAAATESKAGNAPAASANINPDDVSIPKDGYKYEKFNGSGMSIGMVRVQSVPSIKGQWKGRLDDEEEVKIFAKYISYDQYSGVFDRPVNLNVADLDNNAKQILMQSGNNSKILLMKGHSVEILEEKPDAYRCKFTYGKAEIVRDFPKDAVRKTYGGIWYEIESLSDGTKGYVYGSYIKLLGSGTQESGAVKVTPFSGTGTVNDAAVLTAPTSAGLVLRFQFVNNEAVKITGKYVADDKNAAVLNKSTSVMTEKLDQRARMIVMEKGHTASVMLQRGHALEILEERPDAYRCRLTVGRADNVTYDFPKDVVRKINGGTWYQVEMDGKTGYVFGDYLTIK